MKRWLLVGLLMLISVAAYAEEIRVAVGEVKDNRTTGQFFAGLDLKLRLMGDIISDAKGLKVIITRAVDDTGRDLMKPAAGKIDFASPDEQNTGQAEVEIKLKNPSRKAAVIQELSGEAILFVPKNDPDASAEIQNFLTRTGTLLDHKALAASKVEVTVLTKKQFDEIKEQRKKEVKEKEGAMSRDIGEALVQAFSSLFGSMMEIGENSVILNIKDPGSKLISVEFFGEDNNRIRNTSSMTMGETRVYEFENPLPAKARMLISLSAPKALVRTPVKLKDIALP
ncbi:MAG: hypothetical protein EPN25_10530 [Nitrospirae bacterium]|nr:MAG: hypothetical protein EPN25_10530 [Nitrospirota bacterium]